MRTLIATEPGTPGKPNEDAAAEREGFVIVADGATSRTETGCIHGVAWFSRYLVEATIRSGQRFPEKALAEGIQATADAHRKTCDLTNIATPGAAVAAVCCDSDEIHFLVLGDVTIVVEEKSGISVVVDDRVDQTARAERATADALNSGSAEKDAALVAMKHAELAARNVDGGFWAATTDPAVVSQALVWSEPRGSIRRLALVTDGAARAVKPFGLLDWGGLLDKAATDGPMAVIRMVRGTEESDSDAAHWHRNKISDDATVAYVELD